MTVLSDVLSVGELPSFLRFLLTSRPDDRVVGRLPGPRFDLLDDAPADVDDVRLYAEIRLASLEQRESRELASRVARTGEGNFLYARYVIEDLLAHPVLPQGGQIRLPAGLEEHYREFLRRELTRSDETWEDRYRPLLGLLTIAQGDGLTRELLTGATNLPGSRVDAALRRLGQYLEGSFPEGPFRIYHQSFRDFLARDSHYGVYPDEAERALTDRLIAITPMLPGGQRDWSKGSDYARVHLATHAAAAGVLDHLLQDPGYLVAADPDRLIVALPSVTTPSARLPRRVFRGAFDALRRSPPVERASYLEMAAREAGADDFADEVASLEPARPWSARWAHWQAVSEHFIAFQQACDVLTLAIGELEGEPIVLSGGTDGTLRVWHLATGVQRAEPLTGHDGAVLAVALGELEGEPIAVSGGADATLRVWDLTTGVQRGGPLTGHRGKVSAVALGELEGTPIAVAGGHRTLRVWDLTTGVQRGNPLRAHRGDVLAVALGELQGTPIAVSGGDDGTLRVWDLTTGYQHENSRRGGGDAVLAVALGQLDGEPIAVSGGDDGTLRVWDLTTDGRRGWSLVAHPRGVLAVALGDLEGDRVVLSGGADATLRVWDLATGKSRGEPLTGHDRPVRAVALGLLDGEPIAVSGGEDRTVRVWYLASGVPGGKPSGGHDGWVAAVTLGQLEGLPIALTGGSDGALRIWDLATGVDCGWSRTRNREVLAVALGEVNGEPIVISGGSDGTMRIWDPISGVQRGVAAHGVFASRVLAVAFSQLNGQPIAVTGGDDGILRVWELGRAPGAWLIGHEGAVRAVALGNLGDEPIALSGGDDGTVRVWDLTTGTQRGEPLRSHLGQVFAVAISEFGDEPIAVSGGADGTLRVWDLTTGTQRGEPLTGHDRWVLGVAVGEQEGEPIMLSGGDDGTLRVWDVGKKCKLTLRVGSPVLAVAFTPPSTALIGAAGGLMLIDFAQQPLEGR